MKHRSRSRSIAGAVAVGLAAVAGVSCERASTDPVALEARAIPATLIRVAGDGQVGAPGAALPIPATVRAVDSRGNPVPGVPVAFSVAQGGGSAAASGQETDADGLMHAVWTLGSAGPQALEAAITSSKQSRGNSRAIAFTATAQSSGGVASVVVTPSLDTVFVSGHDITLTATARSASGEALSGLPTLWASSDTAVARVDGNGRVRGYKAGAVTVTASVEGVSGSAHVRVQEIPLGQVEISITGDTVLQAGESVALEAAAVGADGAPMSGAKIEWSSSNPEIATVDSMGTLLARSAGAVLIIAAAAGCEPDTAGFSVEPPPVPTNPAPVTDLAVAGVTSSAVTLSWTAVADGNGGVAKYAVRRGSPTLNWGDAYSTEQVVTASAVGDQVSVTYNSLPAGSDQQFRLVSFRGTLNQDAIFGDYSNLVATRTESGSGEQPPPSGSTVTSVTVSPSSYTFTQLGQTLQASATARDASGSVVSGASIAWSSTNPAVVSVDNMGIVTARATGSALIIASSVCCGPADTLSTQVQVEQPPPSSGAALFSDDFESYANRARLEGSGTNGFRWTGAHDGVYVSTDIARSGTKSLKAEYAPYEPGNPSHTHWWAEQNFNLGQAVREVWIEFYIYHLNGTEGLGAAFVRDENSPTKMMTIWSPQGDGYNDAFHTYEYWGRTAGNYARALVNVSGGSGPSYRPGGEVPLPATDLRGTWIRFRMHAKWSSAPGVADGIAQAWINDRLVMSHTNLQHHPQGSSSRAYQNGYLFGYDNQHFPAYTAVYLDDIRIYTGNPGW